MNSYTCPVYIKTYYYSEDLEEFFLNSDCGDGYSGFFINWDNNYSKQEKYDINIIFQL